LKIYDISASGEEKIILFAGPGDIVPVAWTFGKASVSLYYCDAFNDAEVYVVPRSELTTFLQEDKSALAFAFDTYMLAHIGSMLHISALEQSRATEKLVRVLHHLIIRFGKPTAGGKQMIQLRLTHQDLAGMVGLTRETTALELSKLKKKGIISYNAQRYTVDMEKLLSLLGAEEFRQLHLS
jgi:CRP-like cAMP-binding protein